MADDLRTRFNAALKESMLAKDAAKTSTMRMILAKLKDVDIAARPSGVDKVPEEQIVAMLRSMQKSRRESVDLYRQGGREELAAKEEAEIAVIEGFLPQQMDEAAIAAAVDAAIAETGATSVKDMGKVMGVLRKHGGALDMAKANPLVKAKLGG
ncbi:GatB/YqeY domain-containing protein [Roseomonas sp. AR75]|uniref:GatB/YqeY domain-containing protein n=1 Tax=Roseomonas sp. AR75 TaxID=2562311 RepID=UPI0010C0DE90|nr:GatB/YqeY domain-containing protein [Roseomonas sp. AR75]